MQMHVDHLGVKGKQETPGYCIAGERKVCKPQFSWPFQRACQRL